MEPLSKMSTCSEDMRQLLPEGLDQATFEKDVLKLYAHFRSRCSKWSDTMLSFCPYPIYTPPAHVDEARALHSALLPALTAIVRRWWTRPDLQAIIPVSPKMERVLRALEVARPYTDLQVGVFRPDILVPDEPDEPTRICEINARFMFNGYFCGTWTGEGGWLPERFRPTTCTNEDIFATFDQLVDRKRPIGLVTHKEQARNYDLPMYAYNCSAARIVNPADLRLVPSETSASGVAISDGVGLLDQLLLELHQDELEAIDEDILIELGKLCWNDLRTIYFIHDKRMLAIIRRELDWLVGAGYITDTEAQVLRNGIAETYVSRDPIFKSVLTSADPNEKNNWTLKKCMSGKGDGMVFGKNMDDTAWKELLVIQYKMGSAPRNFGGSSSCRSNSRRSSRSSTTSSTTSSRDSSSSCQISEAPSPAEAELAHENSTVTYPIALDPSYSQYILQRYNKPKRLDLIIRDIHIKRPVMRRVSFNIVSTILLVNRTLLSPATYRGNSTDLVALGTGGTMCSGASRSGLVLPYTLPAAAATMPGPEVSMGGSQLLQVPSDGWIKAKTVDGYANEVEAVKASLLKHGLAVVQMEFEDPASDYTVGITRSLGTPLAHSESRGILWDVKPVDGMDSTKGARSETMESFPWHTDCSFEHSPPRYFALHILHRDGFDGGKLRLLHVDHVLDSLSPHTVSILQAPVFKMKVPKEFHKNVTHIVGPLVSVNADGQKKLRFRRDIIEPLGEEAERALKELDEVLVKVDEVMGLAKLLGKDAMKDGNIVLVDNARWLHARSPITDPKRWLRRVRWGPEAFV